MLDLGAVQIRWYGLMYVCGFVVGGWLLNRLAKSGFWPLAAEKIDQYVTVLIVGMFIGARTAYVFIYNWDYYSKNFLDALKVWEGGLSFHGALFGMCVATYLFAKKHKLHFFQIADCMTVAGAQGIFFGRMGNFINAELYGRVTDSPLGIVFPGGGPYPRHASQLYEGVLEGLVLFFLMYALHKRQRIYGIVSAAFVMGYGIVRFIVEFFREPDVQLGYFLGGITMGQILCLIMMLCSVGLFVWARKVKIPNPLVAGRPRI